MSEAPELAIDILMANGDRWEIKGRGQGCGAEIRAATGDLYGPLEVTTGPKPRALPKPAATVKALPAPKPATTGGGGGFDAAAIEQLTALAGAGKTLAEAAAALKRKPAAVYYQANKRGLRFAPAVRKAG